MQCLDTTAICNQMSNKLKLETGRESALHGNSSNMNSCSW